MSITPTHLNNSGDRTHDRGSAMILTLMVMTLVTVLSTTIAVVSINNLQASWRSRQSGAALSAADAGIAQAVSYLRTSGVGDLGCSPTCDGAGGRILNPWGNTASPTVVSMPGVAGQSYRVWIKPIAPFPANNPSTYRIYSTGLAAGDASRAVTADVSITTTTSSVPKGIFGRIVSATGSSSVNRQSVFSTGCVSGRSHFKGTTDGKKGKDKVVMDLTYGIPVAVHSSGTITDAPVGCLPSIHWPLLFVKRDCAPDYPFDQDAYGGALKSSDDCYDERMTGTGPWAKYYSTYDLNSDNKKDPSSVIERDQDLFSIFGFQPSVSQGHLDTLRLLAKSQGTYFTSANPKVSELPATTDRQLVLFFDLKKKFGVGGTVDLDDLDKKFGNKFSQFARKPIHTTAAPTCPSQSLTIVVEGGNVQLHDHDHGHDHDRDHDHGAGHDHGASHASLAATLIVTSGGAPSGTVLFHGADFIGTIFADTVLFHGDMDVSLDACFLANAGPGIAEIAVTSYQEQDRGLS